MVTGLRCSCGAGTRACKMGTWGMRIWAIPRCDSSPGIVSGRESKMLIAQTNYCWERIPCRPVLLSGTLHACKRTPLAMTENLGTFRIFHQHCVPKCCGTEFRMSLRELTARIRSGVELSCGCEHDELCGSDTPLRRF